mmetsp:Transcript_25107/g.30390  ORF Transcript_25107/g.30390 Transcript_25107/m.30390 type:complete len:336 (-) Transcript_25107:684-1691(-)|eukprot:CAMPEP_0197845784 /NCGR_PEP_ID=MMETSP1438-20131217/2664_1 /TAXON_ID=1461541 /ORGANISM="Pterosperma sp., Strain CCMP1384" /LENGTH=335 /DNA_ID=CAMNT_0043457211 /DNA_START=465 /DNA_END=1472 /DNA_ORIENTATION=+
MAASLPRITTAYRSLLRLALRCESKPGNKALLQSPFHGQDDVDLFNADLPQTLRNFFRNSGGSESAQSNGGHLSSAQLAAVDQVMHEFHRNINRRQQYMSKWDHARTSGEAAPLTPNQMWFESRLREDADLAPQHSSIDASRLLQDALGSATPPTPLMCTSAIKHAIGQPLGPPLGGLLTPVRSLELLTNHVPDADMAGAVVEGLMKVSGALRGLAAAEAFVGSGVTPSSSALTALVVAVREEVHQSNDTSVSARPDDVEREGDMLQRLGMVLIPILSTPLTNVGALEEYIRICEKHGTPLARECGLRAQSYMVAHTIFAEEEAEGDEIMGLPMD